MNNAMKKDDKIKIVARKKFACPYCKKLLSESFISKTAPDMCIECPDCNKLFYFKTDVLGVSLKTKNERAEDRCEVSLAVTYSSRSEFLKEYTKNVSRGGMFVKTKNYYEAGKVIDLHLHIPEMSEPIKIKSEVVHVRKGSDTEDAGVGVKFIGITKTNRDRVIAYIKQHKCE